MALPSGYTVDAKIVDDDYIVDHEGKLWRREPV